MTPYFSDAWLDIYQGDVRDVLPSLPADSVDCIVTSPPYWGLRDYANDGQLGLERTPEEYVANMVGVFRELRRVLKPSGTCWLNLGDSYANGAAGGDRRMSDATTIGRSRGKDQRLLPHAATAALPRAAKAVPLDLKPKDLVGIPWRVAFALQADGWYLRSDIIWAKPNPMPESVTDRPTKSHEYLFLLTKSARYYFDADAVREPHAYDWSKNAEAMNRLIDRGEWKAQQDKDSEKIGTTWKQANFPPPNPLGRNLRSVWTIATKPYPGAHFAVFPPELPERCIKAGSSERGVCPECGAPWERVVERGMSDYERLGKVRGERNDHQPGNVGSTRNGNGTVPSLRAAERTLAGWAPSCRHETLKSEPAVILDPFAGSGTTGLVANRLSRRAILVDLNGDYLKQQLKRNAQTPLGLGA